MYIPVPMGRLLVFVIECRLESPELDAKFGNLKMMVRPMARLRKSVGSSAPADGGRRGMRFKLVLLDPLTILWSTGDIDSLIGAPEPEWLLI